MANKTATLSQGLKYTGLDGETVTVPTVTTHVLYGVQANAELEVGDGDAQGTEYEVPFGGIEIPTLLWCENKTGQELTLSINGNELHAVPDGSFVIPLASPSAATSGIESISFTSTAMQSGVGVIVYRLFGDPEAP